MPAATLFGEARIMRSSSMIRSVLLGGSALIACGSIALAQSLTVTDLTGRQIMLDGPSERIVTFPVPSASVIIGLDGGIDRLAGIHPEAKLAIEEGILGEFFPDAADIPSAILAGGADRGRTPDIAALEALSPDFVVQWEHAGEDAESLIEAGFNTGLLVFGTEDNVRDAIAMLGEAIGETQKVDMLMAWRDEVSSEIEAGLAEIPAADRPTVAYFYYALTEFHTEGLGTYFDWQLRHLGVTNAAGGIEGFGEVPIEMVAEWNPDIILLGNYEPGLDTGRVTDDPLLGDTVAAQDARVYMMPLGGYRWGPGSIESPLAWMWMANLFYPDHFDFDIRGEVEAWYPRIYGHTPTASQIDEILELEINSESAHYEMMMAP